MIKLAPLLEKFHINRISFEIILQSWKVGKAFLCQNDVLVDGGATDFSVRKIAPLLWK